MAGEIEAKIRALLLPQPASAEADAAEPRRPDAGFGHRARRAPAPCAPRAQPPRAQPQAGRPRIFGSRGRAAARRPERPRPAERRAHGGDLCRRAGAQGLRAGAHPPRAAPAGRRRWPDRAPSGEIDARAGWRPWSHAHDKKFGPRSRRRSDRAREACPLPEIAGFPRTRSPASYTATTALDGAWCHRRLLSRVFISEFVP